jgi:hypothetical protein
MIYAIVKLQSEVRHHGAREIKATRDTAAAVARVRKNFLTTKAEIQTGKEPSERKILPLDHRPKAYGSHNGQKHSAILGETKFEDFSEFEEFLSRTSLAMSMLESHPNLDLKAKKEEYRSKRDAIAKEIRQKYGVSVDSRGTTEYQNRCAECSFNYVSSQIVLILWSENEFPGSELDKRRNLYVAAYPCKTNYSQTLLSGDFVRNLKMVMSTGHLPEGVSIYRPRFAGHIEVSNRGSVRVRLDVPNRTQLGGRSRASVDKESWVMLET